MFKILLIFIFGAVAGGTAAWLFLRKSCSRHSDILENVGMSGSNPRTGEVDKEPLIKKQAREKEENKQSILGILENQSPLTNNHVEQLLGISDATATRYFDELEKEGKVRQVGKTGRHVYYEKI